jgi:aspartyl-tRNA synthetase
MGSIIFIDLRDISGLVQVVFDKSMAEANDLRPEYVVELEGKVVLRSEKNVNPNLKTGRFEIQASSLKILAKAKTPPFQLDNEEKMKGVSEELRLKYRYLDLRRGKMQTILKKRAEIIKFIRDFLTKENFIEIETPILTKGTPEGAREYIVPSRNFPGKFYVLPQSPQQFKQLLMVSGLERYFQIARCFRDEDPRSDRQPEFTQLDLEMSFVDEEDVLNIVEKLFISLLKKLFPEKKLTFGNKIPRLTYQEAIEKYKSDKPDLRKDKNDKNEIAFCFIIDFPLFVYSEEEKRLVPQHHLFTSPKDKDMKLLDLKPEKALAKQYDFVMNGYEIAGGSIRIHNPEIQQKIFKILKIEEDEAKRRFGHLLEAFSYGAPPHGGIASGIDRVVAILCAVENIREVIAFPKTADAKDLMMGAPSELSDEQIKEANIKIVGNE